VLVELTQDNFHDHLRTRGPLLVQLYARSPSSFHTLFLLVTAKSPRRARAAAYLNSLVLSCAFAGGVVSMGLLHSCADWHRACQQFEPAWRSLAQYARSSRRLFAFVLF
jgi:hypothetical protein